MERVIVESLKSPARVWRAVMEGLLLPDDSIGPGKFGTQTLIVWGERETLFSRAEQEALVSANPNARLKVYTETAHSPHWERPQQFAADLNEFLRQAGQ